MADNPTNPQGELFSQQGAGTPANVPGINPEMNEWVKNAASAAADMRNLAEELSRLKQPAAAVTATLDDWKVKLKAIVDFSSDTEDSFKRLLQLNQRFADSGIFKAKTYRQMKDNLEDLLDANKRLREKGFFSEREQNQLERGIDRIGNAISDLESSMKAAGRAGEDMLDPDAFARVVNYLQEMVEHTDHIRENFRKTYLTPMARGMSDLARHAGITSKFLQQMEKSAQAAGSIKKFREEIRREGAKDFQANLRKSKAAAARLGVEFNIPFDKKGRVDMEALRRQSPQRGLFVREAAVTAAREMSNRRGLAGYIDRKIAARTLQGVATGEPGLLSRLGAQTMARGGGSFTTGVANAVVSGSAGATQLLNQGLAAAGPYGAVAEMIMNLLDQNAARNRGVAEKLGTAGVFGRPGMTAQSSMLAARNALLPNIMDMGYQSFERNMAIAGGMANAGVNVGPQMLTGSMQGGAMGTIKGLVYGAAKTAGFVDEGQATEQIMKLLQRYSTTLEGTQKFFEDINRDTARAGITTTKYIQIIDDVNSQFDRFGQSLESTVNMMRILGKTGTASAEDVKEALNSMANAGAKRSDEISSFIYAEAARAGRIPELVKGQETQRTEFEKAAREQLGKVGVNADLLKGIDLSTTQGVFKAQALLRGRKGAAPAEDQQAYFSADQALSKLMQQNVRVQYGRRALALAQQGQAGQAGYMMAVGKGYAGTNLLQQTFENMEAIRDTYHRFGLRIGQTGGLQQEAGIMNTLRLQGIDPASVIPATRGMQRIAGAITSQAKAGVLNREETLSPLVRIASGVMGAKQPLSGKSSKEQLADFFSKATEQQQAEFQTRLGESPEMLRQIYDIESGSNEALNTIVDGMTREEQDRRGHEIAVNTRPMAEVFANAFEWLFNKISDPLVRIMNLLEGSALFGGGTATTEEQNRVYNRFRPGGEAFQSADQVRELLPKLEDRQKELQAMLDSPDTPPEAKQALRGLITRIQSVRGGLSQSLSEMQRDIDRSAGDQPGIRTTGEIAQSDINTQSVAQLLGLGSKMTTTDIQGLLHPQPTPNPAAATQSASWQPRNKGEAILGHGSLASQILAGAATPVTSNNTTFNTYAIGVQSTGVVSTPSTNSAVGESTPAQAIKK